MTIESIQAVQACMKFLRLRIDHRESKKIECQFHNDNGRGLMFVQFMNDVHGHQGPYISFDETIKGFGVQYQTFKPAFQDFVFMESNGTGTLTCSGKSFEFHLRFIN